jgi:lipoprotein-anchoring transpeptidase ErfK/SrfK
VLKFLVRCLPVALALGLASCATKPSPHLIRISVPDQKMLVFERGAEIARYDVSTSKFGLGDRPGSYATPLGTMQVAQKIGGGQPSGMKFKSRRPTGEIVPPDSPGRDPIVSRILWLRGLEVQNRGAYGRGIYIHGTAEEHTIGTPASYGCIRMRSRDVIALYNKIEVGARVEVTTNHFPASLQGPGNDAPVQQLTMPKTLGPITPTPGNSPPPPAITVNTPSQRRG